MANEENVREWFKYASRDLDSAKHLMETMWPKPLEVVCFLCQQAAEKFMKGVIVSFDDEPPKIHDLAQLRKMLDSRADTSFIARECTYLIPFAVASRYPYGPEVDEPQTHLALTYAERVKAWAESLVQLDAKEASEAAKDNGVAEKTDNEEAQHDKR